MQTDGAFAWASPLGISVLLFLAYGTLYVFVGVAAGFVISGALSGALGPDVGSRALFNTTASDTAAFGLEREPVEILSSDPVFAGVRRLLLIVVSGLLTAAGTLVIAVAWFGLREGQAWALIALTVAGLAVIPFWWAALLRSGQQLGRFVIERRDGLIRDSPTTAVMLERKTDSNPRRPYLVLTSPD